MSNVFKDIYNKELNLNFRNLNNKDSEAEEDTSLNVVDLPDDILDTLFNNLYNRFNPDDVPVYSKNEVKVIDEKIKRNRKEAKVLKQKLQELKSDIVNEVKDKAFVLDISKSNALTKASNNIFGGNKKKITYEDYLVLLEMKKQIIISESSEILSEV